MVPSRKLSHATVLLLTLMVTGALRTDLLPDTAVKDGYVCRNGQGQPGQNYKNIAGDLAACQAACNVDQTCMGIDASLVSKNGVQSGHCRLFGANVPVIGKVAEANQQYCVRINFDAAGAIPVPGDGHFAPTLDWLESKLQVPVDELNCKQLKGGGSKGASGASFFKCDGTYGGSIAEPTLGLPKDLFVKVRSPTQGINAFESENAVAALMKYLSHPPALARVLSADRNYMIMENMGGPVEDGYRFTEKEKFAVLDTYAEFHSAFWGLGKAPGLKTLADWAPVFTGGRLDSTTKSHYLEWFQVPEPQLSLVKRAFTEIGAARMLNLVNEFGTTLIQGDAHQGQVLFLSDGSSAKKGNRTFGLIDFGEAILASSAIDIGSLIALYGSAEHEKFIGHYFENLVRRTGCVELGRPNPRHLPKCSVEDFKQLCRIAAILRGMFVLSHVAPMFGEALEDKDFFKNYPEHAVHLPALQIFFEAFDQDTFDYLASNVKDIPMEELCGGIGQCLDWKRQVGCKAKWSDVCPQTPHPAGQQFKDEPIGPWCPAECKDSSSSLLDTFVNPWMPKQSVSDAFSAREIQRMRDTLSATVAATL